jgi:hypothetical protein
MNHGLPGGLPLFLSLVIAVGCPVAIAGLAIRVISRIRSRLRRKDSYSGGDLWDSHLDPVMSLRTLHLVECMSIAGEVTGVGSAGRRLCRRNIPMTSSSRKTSHPTREGFGRDPQLFDLRVSRPLESRHSRQSRGVRIWETRPAALRELGGPVMWARAMISALNAMARPVCFIEAP